MIEGHTDTHTHTGNEIPEGQNWPRVKIKIKNPFHLAKRKLFHSAIAQGNADIAAQWYRVGPLSILIFKKLAGL